MSNPIVTRYKLPFLFSLIIGLLVIILQQEESWVSAAFAFIGALVGLFLVDAEYLVHVYLVDPSSDISNKIKAYFSSRSWSGLIDLYNREEYTFGELAIRSVLFQVLLAVFSFLMVTSNAMLFVVALVLSMSTTLLYFQIMEYNRTGTLERWFWIYNGTPTRQLFNIYLIIIGVVLVYQFFYI